MSKDDKLKPGDLAFIIKSANNKSIGKVVECVKTDGEHSKYGLMWLVKSNSHMTSTNGERLLELHCPQDWLKKIPNDPLSDDEDTVVEKILELENV
jgi:hypothetical protein